MKRRHSKHILLPLSGSLRKQLEDAAARRRAKLKTEILQRLERSFPLTYENDFQRYEVFETEMERLVDGYMDRPFASADAINMRQIDMMRVLCNIENRINYRYRQIKRDGRAGKARREAATA